MIHMNESSSAEAEYQGPAILHPLLLRNKTKQHIKENKISATGY